MGNFVDLKAKSCSMGAKEITMNNQKSITVLLAIIALLLTVNLVMQFETSAQAETQTNLGPPVPKVVGGSGVYRNGGDFRLDIIRIWDNGDVDLSMFTNPSGNECFNFAPHCQIQLIGGQCDYVDLTGDGIVNTEDLLLMFASWGECSLQ